MVSMGDSVSTIERLRERFQDEPTKFVTWYVITGVFAILIPGLNYGIGMHKYHNSYYYSYVQSENAEDQDYRNDYHDINNCKWWQVSCSSVWVNTNGEEQEIDREEGNEWYGSHSTPSWISGWGTNIGASRDGVSSHSTASLKFVYSWQLLMFLGLLAYGALVIFKYRGNLAQSRIALQSLWLLIFGFGNFSWLSMWMLANGSIFSGGQELEEVGGFYHQFSVLMFTTNFWYVLWSLAFILLIGRRVRNIRQVEALNETSEDYISYKDPADDTSKGKSPV